MSQLAKVLAVIAVVLFVFIVAWEIREHRGMNSPEEGIRIQDRDVPQVTETPKDERIEIPSEQQQQVQPNPGRQQPRRLLRRPLFRRSAPSYQPQPQQYYPPQQYPQMGGCGPQMGGFGPQMGSGPQMGGFGPGCGPGDCQ